MHSLPLSSLTVAVVAWTNSHSCHGGMDQLDHLHCTFTPLSHMKYYRPPCTASLLWPLTLVNSYMVNVDHPHCTINQQHHLYCHLAQHTVLLWVHLTVSLVAWFNSTICTATSHNGLTPMVHWHHVQCYMVLCHRPPSYMAHRHHWHCPFPQWLALH
jgi:hypothetical protein